MDEAQIIELFRCLADKSRLLILKNLIKEPMYVELLSERLNLTPSTISFHLKKLMNQGIVTSKKEQYYVVYQVEKEILKHTLIELISVESTQENEQLIRENAYREKVINSFFEYGKLKSIPVQKKKARIIYEEIAKAFEPEKQYTEREVNMIIADFNDDFCTIRRDMVGEKLLVRNEGVYELGVLKLEDAISL